MSTIPSYPFDPTGLLASNLIAGEQQIITANNWRDYHFIVPKYAPYFMDTMKIIYKDTVGVQKILQKGVDWYESHEFISASRACATPIFGSISFLNTSLAGVVTLQYQTIGGIWVQDEQKISEILANVLHNPRVTAWEEVIDMPYAFPPIDHEWNLVDMVGMSEVVESLRDIETYIRQQGQDGLVNHLADFNNPHRVSAEQVGLGYVRNMPTASKAEAMAGTSDNVYLTPWSANQLVTALFGNGMNTHLQDFNNPHRVTAEQVNAYNKQAMDSLLASKLNTTDAAADASKFNGMLPAEYAAYVLQGTAANSILFSGRTYLQLLEDVQGGASANAMQFNGMDQDAYKAFVLGSGVAYDSARFGGVLYNDFVNNIANSTVLNSQNLNGLSLAQVTTQILSGTASNAAKFGGLSPGDYAISVLQGTAANAETLAGMTPSQLAAWIMSSTSAGAASDSLKFAGMDKDQYKEFVLATGSAYDSNRFGGLTPTEFIDQVQQGTSANADMFAGMNYNDWQTNILGLIDGKAANQTTHLGTTGESIRTNYRALGNLHMPSAGEPASAYPDAFWLVSGGDSNGGVDSTLFLVRVNVRGTIGTPIVNVKCIHGNGSDATFGWNTTTIDDPTSPGGSYVQATIYISTAQDIGTITVTELSRSQASTIFTEANVTAVVPTGFQVVNGPYATLVDSNDFAVLQADVASAFDSLTTAFNNLQTSLGV